MADSCRA